MRVTLNGIVSSDEDRWIYEFFGYSAFSPEQVRQAIAENPEGEELILEINSGGGSVMAGSEIYSVLRSAEGVETRAEIQSLAASAASYLALGCDVVMISPVAQMMMHLPSTCTEGDRDDHMVSVRMLDAVRDSILNAYEIKAAGKADRAELRRMMSSETWLTAQQARELGLVDGILFEDEGNALPQNIMNAAGAGIRALGASGGVPNIARLRDEYRRLNPPAPEEPDPEASTGGAPEAHNSQSWQAEARLALEKIRF